MYRIYVSEICYIYEHLFISLPTYLLEYVNEQFHKSQVYWKKVGRGGAI